jgi:subtilisin family serine protease
MKRGLMLAVLLMVIVSALSVSAVGAQNNRREWLVISANGTTGTAVMNAQVRMSGGIVTRTFNQVGVSVVVSADSRFANRMEALGLLAAPNRVVRNADPLRTYDVASPEAGLGLSNTFAPLQWSLGAIRATEGWINGRRGNGAVVAVLDEGFFLDHPDLAANFDTSLAASFVPGEGVQWTAAPGFSHGTHVSGIIAAVDNTTGTVGVAPETTIVPIKVLSEQLGYGLDSWVIAGMLYASEIGVDVVNMSLGGTCDTQDPDRQLAKDCKATKKVYDAVGKLMRLRGVTVIASAGNDGLNYDMYPSLVKLPAMASGILSISATGPEGWAVYPVVDPRRPASYSSFGRRLVDFAAPGGDFAYPGNEGCLIAPLTSPIPCWALDMVIAPSFVTPTRAFYSWAAGTSMAAPHVAGIAAQIIGANGGSMAPALVERQLRRWAEKLSPKDFYGQGFTRAN